jgi:hypothetical protein
LNRHDAMGNKNRNQSEGVTTSLVTWSVN